jgi:hypothetical protein
MGKKTGIENGALRELCCVPPNISLSAFSHRMHFGSQLSIEYMQ